MLTDRSTALIAVDYGGVLTNPIAETIGGFCARTQIPAEALLKAITEAAEAGDATVMEGLERGTMSEAVAVERVRDALTSEYRSRFPEPSAFRETWLRERSANLEMLAAVDEARDTYRAQVALASNNVAEWEQNWRQTVSPMRFDYEVISCEHGVRKPESRFFEVLLETTGREAGDVIFFDDVEENVQAARRHGIRAELFEGAEAFRSSINTWFASHPRELV